jgi:hypothetical protein
MHIGSLNVLDRQTASSGDFFEDTQAHIWESACTLAVIFTRKLALMPWICPTSGLVDDGGH